MKIGIDLDGVIFDTERAYRTLSEIYDVDILKRNSIVDNNELKLQNRYNWSNEEIQDFFNKYNTKIIENASFIPGSKEVLTLLKNSNNQLILMTALGLFVKDGQSISEKILKQNDMYIFDKYYWNVADKKSLCQSENIDIMIDDYDNECLKIASSKPHVIYLKDSPYQDIINNKHIITLFGWGDIYRYIKNL